MQNNGIQDYPMDMKGKRCLNNKVLDFHQIMGCLETQWGKAVMDTECRETQWARNARLSTGARGEGMQGYPSRQGMHGYPSGQGMHGFPPGYGRQPGFPPGHGGYGDPPPGRPPTRPPGPPPGHPPGQQQSQHPPTSAPPSTAPEYPSTQLFAVDPGAIGDACIGSHMFGFQDGKDFGSIQYS